MAVDKYLSFIEGEKVYLRPYEETDWELMYEGVNLYENALYTGGKELFSKSDVKKYVEKAMKNQGSYSFVIVRKGDNQAVGEVVLNELDERKANIRILMFRKEFFNNGYGTEGMRLMLGYGFGMLNLHRISLGVYEHNPRAIHVYEKLGFVKEGVLRDELYFNHRYYNYIMMSILQPEYEKRYLNNIEVAE